MTRLAAGRRRTHGRGAARRACWPAGWAEPDDLVVVEPVAARRDELAEPLPGRRRERPSRSRPTASSWRSSRTRSRPRARRWPAWASAGCCRSPPASPSPASRPRLAPGTPVVRAMPNTPALVGAGAAAIAGGHLRLGRRPRLGRGDPRRGRARRAGRRAPARRGDRPVGLGPGLRVPGGRGPDRGRRPGRAAPRRQPRPRRGHPARVGPAAGRDRRRPGRPAGRGDLAGRHDRGRPAGARGPGHPGRLHRRGGRRHRPARASWPTADRVR